MGPQMGPQMGHMALQRGGRPTDRRGMQSSLLTTLTVPQCATVPRRRMGLLEVLNRHLCPAESLPVVEVTEIMPVISMFDYDPGTAIEVTDLSYGTG